MMTAMALEEHDEPVMRLTHKLYMGDLLVARIRSDGKRWLLETLDGSTCYHSLFDVSTKNAWLNKLLWEKA